MEQFIFLCKVFLIIKMLKKVYIQKEVSSEEYAELAIMIGDAIHNMNEVL